jgi:hypothetical protein
MSALLAALAIALPAAGGHDDPADRPRRHATCRTHACSVRVARKACERGSVTACVRHGARQHGVDERRLLRVAMCESTMNPDAVNGQYQGLYQFGAALWRRLRYWRYSRFSAKWSSLAAALAFRRGLEGHWECKG